MRRSLWDEHFDWFLSAHPDLSAQQHAVVGRARVLADQTHASTSRTSTTKKSLRELEADIVQAFGPRQAHARAGTLGPSEPREASSASEPDCSCYSHGGAINSCGGGNTNCIVNVCVACNMSKSGCGPFWLYQCDSLCGSSPNSQLSQTEPSCAGGAAAS